MCTGDGLGRNGKCYIAVGHVTGTAGNNSNNDIYSSEWPETRKGKLPIKAGSFIKAAILAYCMLA